MMDAMTGGVQVPGGGTGDDGYDEDGYDESQRAEILETTRDGPTDGMDGWVEAASLFRRALRCYPPAKRRRQVRTEEPREEKCP